MEMDWETAKLSASSFNCSELDASYVRGVQFNKPILREEIMFVRDDSDALYIFFKEFDSCDASVRIPHLFTSADLSADWSRNTSELH